MDDREIHSTMSQEQENKSCRGIFSMSSILSSNDAVSSDECSYVSRDNRSIVQESVNKGHEISVNKLVTKQENRSVCPQRVDFDEFSPRTWENPELDQLQADFYQNLRSYLLLGYGSSEISLCTSTVAQKKSKKAKVSRQKQLSAAQIKEKHEIGMLMLLECKTLLINNCILIQERKNLLDAKLVGMDECIQLLCERSEFSVSVMHNMTTLCTDLLSWMDSHDCIQQYLVICKGESGEVIDYDSTINCVKKHDVYGRLVSILDRLCSYCYSQEMRATLWLQVLQWIHPTFANLSSTTTTNGDRWCWIFGVFGDRYVALLMQFLFERAITLEQNVFLDEKEILVSLLQYLSQKHSLQAMSLMNQMVHRLADPSSAYFGKSLWRSALLRLIDFSLQVPGILLAIDGQIEWVVSIEVVSAIFTKHMTMVSSRNDESSSTLAFEDSLSSQLLKVYKSSQLQSSSIQFLELLDRLINHGNNELAQCAAAFHARLAEEFSESATRHTDRENLILLSNLSPSIPLMCKNMMDSRQQDGSFASVWNVWLEALSESSRTLMLEIVIELARQEIFYAGFKGRIPSASVTIPEVIKRTQESDQKKCVAFPWDPICWSEFIKRLARQCREQYHAFLVYLSATLKTISTPGKFRRIFSLIRVTLNCRSHCVDATQMIESLHEAKQDCIIQRELEVVWTYSNEWLDCCGRMFWEHMLDFACSRQNGVVTLGLELLQKLPIPPFHDSARRYRGIYRLFTAFKRQLGLRAYDNKYPVCSRETLRNLDLIRKCQMRIFHTENSESGSKSCAFTTYVEMWMNHVFSAKSTCYFPTSFSDDGASNIDEIDYERTISTKCTSYPVRTTMPAAHIGDSSFVNLVASQRCAMIALHTLQTHICKGFFVLSTRQLEMNVTKLFDSLLERFLPCCGIPSDDVYKEKLPNRSHFDVDIRMEQWLHHCPTLLPLVRLMVDIDRKLDLSQSLRLLPLLKSALVVLMGYWNSLKGTTEIDQPKIPPYMKPKHQLYLTYQLVEILRWTKWFPASMVQQTQYLLPFLTPLDIRSVLLSFWTYLANYPPSDLKVEVSSLSSSSKANWVTSDPFDESSDLHPLARISDLDRSFYLVPIRRALDGNIQKIRTRYAYFKCSDNSSDKEVEKLQDSYESFERTVCTALNNKDR
uniref:Uncharacterized protein AlNc14C399G11351 n=1 Tax=Albugo laibachii Nc14 TaxID=890382 RepID=F0WYU1_9STRA|nr:conserved hypothetical protein [Albugo laibachii Nc14]|eukprot:CCA26650.1 conserved hypothetical protein [Albugo laibachii Nc14]